jgi:uncharacterized protein YjbI with pentapeptide repeats
MKVEKATLLSAYYGWIGDLAVAGRFTGPNSAHICQIARARTLATLKLLQPQEKSHVVKFLYDAGLIVNQVGGASSEKKSAVIALNGADLNELDCAQLQMDGLCIVSAFLNRANFRGAFLYQANLSACDLIQADLSFANLDEANLLMADLTQANLRGASLRGAIILDEQLAQAACIEDIQR